MSPSLVSIVKAPIRLLSVAALILAISSSVLHAQLDLEGSVPADWSVTAGTLSISPHHYKLGTESLRWDWDGGSVLTVSTPGIVAADVLDFNKNTCDFWVWNGTAIPAGKLRVEFMNGTTAQYWFDFYLDYTGWRRAVRSYRYDMSKKSSPSSTFTSVRITAPASGAGSFFLDKITWAGARFDRTRDAQNPDIAGYDSSLSRAADYAVVPTLPLDSPTATELAELATIRARWTSAIRGSSAPGSSSVTTANTLFGTLDIVEDANGIRGKVLGDYAPLEDLLTLARNYAWNTASATASRDRMLLLARHLLDQGHAANSNSVPGLWYDYRDLANAQILMAPAYDAATKARYWEFFRWNNKLGKYWGTTWERNTDDIHTGVVQSLGALLFLTPDDAEAVRQLKGFKLYINRFWEFSSGSEDGLKVDGLGFHHRSHYNNYMYAYGPMATALYHLRGTGFQIDQAPYENLRLAFLAQMRMSAHGSGTTVGYYGNALCGRKPFDINITYNQTALRQMGEVGGQFYGQSADPVVARAHNLRYGVNNYALFTPYGAESPPDGFHQFNYSPLGVYRRANWLASIRAPQRFFWSSEIYPDSNRYGRYQSYGALEILYHGGMSASGMQLNGYDWNQPPGTTTIILPNTKLVALDGREDVRSQLNFSGALSFHDGQSGLYGANFQETAHDANYNPSFVWRKSWFAFGSQIIALGSDITNDDDVNPTATTLFQARLSSTSTAINLDGSSITSFPHDSTASGASAHWLLDAFGTGYLVQPGDNLKISRATQTSPNHTGTGSATTGNFAKVWLDHGTAPSGAGYEYAVFPATTSTAMAASATEHADATTKPYQIIQRDSTAHVVKWKATDQIGYSIFTTDALPANTQNAGLLMSVQRPCLVMTQLNGNADTRISVVDPNLNFTNLQAGYGVPDASRPRTLDLTVRGLWILENPESGTSIVAANGVTTTFRVTTQHGLAEHLHLIKPPGLATWVNLGSNWTAPENWGGALPANDLSTDIAAFGAATVQPVLDSAWSLRGITLGGGTILSGNGNLALGINGIVSTGTGNVLTLAGITLPTSQTWDVSTGDLTVPSAITGAAGAGLTKTGAGTLALTGRNAYSGGLTVLQGIVSLLGDQSAATGSIDQQAAGTSLLIGSATQTAATGVLVGSGGGITIGDTAASGTAERIFDVIGSPDFATTVTNHGSLTTGRGSLATVGQHASWLQNGTMMILGVGDYSGSLAVTAGALFVYNGTTGIQMNPASDNSGQARLAVTGGATFTTARGFVFGSPGTGAGIGSFTLSGQSKLRLTASIDDLFAGHPTGRVELGNGGGIIDTNGFTTTLARDLTNAPSAVGSLRKQGDGTLILPGSNAYTGPTTITGGVLSTGLLASGGTASGIGAATNSSANLVIDGGTLKYTGVGVSPTRGYTVGVNGTEFDTSSSTGTLWFNSAAAFTGSGARSITATTGTGTLRLGLIGDGDGGSTRIVKKGAGTLMLTSTNTYTGQLQILQGTVQYGNAGAGGESTGIGHSVAISSGGELRFRHGNQIVTYDAPISGAGKVNFNYNNGTPGGSLTLAGDNSFTGGLTISPSSGTHLLTMFAGNTNALGSGNVTIGQYAKLDLNGFGNSTGLLISEGTNGLVTNDGAADATLTLSGNGTQTYGGVIQDGAKKVSIIKDGSGIQFLTGGSAYSGGTTVLEGTLSLGQVNFSNEASALSIAAGAFLNLGFAGIDTVDRLFIGGVQQPATDYTSAHASGRFTGGGTLRVTTGPVAPGFTLWIGNFSLDPADRDPTDDPDKDGINNLLEFVLNGDPTASESSILPTAEVSTSHITFTYQRRDDSVSPEIIQTFQWGTILAAWPASVVVPAASVSLPSVIVIVGPGVPSDSETDTVQISIPKTEAGNSGKLFGRLVVRQ